MVLTPKKPFYRSLAAWEALKQRDLEYAINLLVAGEWKIDGVVKDDYSSLDAKVGSERCQETAALVLILRREIVSYLAKTDLIQEFKVLIEDYRVHHAGDKQWSGIFTTNDIYTGNSSAYDAILQSVVDYIGFDWTTFLCHARTLASFSVLSTTEFGIPIRYRRLGEILVETTPEQRDTGLGKYHDAEFSMRTEFTEVSFRLIDKLSTMILPRGRPELPFSENPRRCQTAAEQAREIFHFSKAIKRPGCHEDYPITIGSFCASMQILLRLCWGYGIPVTVCMPRLRYDGPHPVCNGDSIGVMPAELATYELTSAPVITYIPANENGGGFKMVHPKQAGIEDEPCWKLLGYSMYHNSQPGRLLSSPDDIEYVNALKEIDLNHIVSTFGFFHEEYPARTETPPDVDALYKTVCGDDGAIGLDTTFEGGFNSSGMNPNEGTNTMSLLESRNAVAKLSEKHHLKNTFISHQEGLNTSYQMQHKPIPFTFSHIDVSTPRTEELKWAAMLHKHKSTTEPMFANLFTVGNAVYSMRDKDEADRLMRMNNNNQKIRDLMAIHPSHVVFLRDDHKEKWERWQTERQNKNKVKL